MLIGGIVFAFVAFLASLAIFTHYRRRKRKNASASGLETIGVDGGSTSRKPSPSESLGLGFRPVLGGERRRSGSSRDYNGRRDLHPSDEPLLAMSAMSDDGGHRLSDDATDDSGLDNPLFKMKQAEEGRDRSIVKNPLIRLDDDSGKVAPQPQQMKNKRGSMVTMESNPLLAAASAASKGASSSSTSGGAQSPYKDADSRQSPSSSIDNDNTDVDYAASGTDVEALMHVDDEGVVSLPFFGNAEGVQTNALSDERKQELALEKERDLSVAAWQRMEELAVMVQNEMARIGKKPGRGSTDSNTGRRLATLDGEDDEGDTALLDALLKEFMTGTALVAVSQDLEGAHQLGGQIEEVLKDYEEDSRRAFEDANAIMEAGGAEAVAVAAANQVVGMESRVKAKLDEQRQPIGALKNKLKRVKLRLRSANAVIKEARKAPPKRMDDASAMLQSEILEMKARLRPITKIEKCWFEAADAVRQKKGIVITKDRMVGITSQWRTRLQKNKAAKTRVIEAFKSAGKSTDTTVSTLAARWRSKVLDNTKEKEDEDQTSSVAHKATVSATCAPTVTARDRRRANEADPDPDVPEQQQQQQQQQQQDQDAMAHHQQYQEAYNAYYAQQQQQNQDATAYYQQYQEAYNAYYGQQQQQQNQDAMAHHQQYQYQYQQHDQHQGGL